MQLQTSQWCDPHLSTILAPQWGQDHMTALPDTHSAARKEQTLADDANSGPMYSICIAGCALLTQSCCQCHQVQTSHCPLTSVYRSQKSKSPGRSQHTLPAAAHFAQWHLWTAACLTLSMQRATWQILHPACMLNIWSCHLQGVPVYTVWGKQQRRIHQGCSTQQELSALWRADLGSLA